MSPAAHAATMNSKVETAAPNGPASKKLSQIPLTNSTTSPKKVNSHRSSKPLLHWFQRKLAGTVRSKREHPTKGRNSSPIPLRPTNRIVSTALTASGVNGGLQNRQTISLNGDSIDHSSIHSTDDLGSTSDRSSVARDSMWSPASAVEADEDASVRPLPPSSPPSPSPSRSSSSYLSNPRTFRSIAASTKPTTLLSIDLHGNGMAHIAQAPITPTGHRFNHARNSSTNSTNALSTGPASVTFSALPSPPQDHLQSSTVQAPLHTQHHPRNNPRPSSPPLDNASVLTLASSAYAHPGLRPGAITPGWGSSPPSAVGGGGADSFSQYGGSTYEESTSQFPLGDEDRDVDASVRALRPRSSRRGSWESEVSRWSARIQVGTPSLARERSLWTTNSVRTGGFSSENMEVFDNDKSDEAMDTEVEGGALDDKVTPTTAPPHSPSADTVGDKAVVKPEDVPLPPDSEVDDRRKSDALQAPLVVVEDAN
ncbi:hypothetical protein BDZ89DRAFT_1110756 [Hymenopellis radicata]|nr:hypothetical protein BDZ89DRAFT_1110756 [Hymenopellis radicata]